jgi:Xaa-Pro aminopeptidase
MATALKKRASASAGPRTEADDAHRPRRERFLESIGDGVAVLCAAPEQRKSRDTDGQYRQDSDFFYLTGFGEPDAVAVFNPHDAAARFTLFVRPRNPEREVWDGPRAGPEGAVARYGADAAFDVAELDDRLKPMLEHADAVWYALGSNPEMDGRLTAIIRGYRYTRGRSGKWPVDVRDPGTVLDAMRRVKEPAELDRIRAAARLSARAHVAVMAAARPGIGEWELAAAIDATFRAEAADAYPAYRSIVGSGPNATILHYVSNHRRANGGELVLVDAGAELEMYCGDITRTFPVSGRFSPPQRAVYNVVLEALEAAIAAVRPGARVDQVHEAARLALVRGMVKLKLLSGKVDELLEGEEYKKFFMHQTSHWLGMDVHDAGMYRDRSGDWVTLEPGMVLTVEPGLYIPRDAKDVPAELRGIGVRIEDDVIVTADGREVITRDVPVDPDEIEALVGGAGK